MGVVIPVFVMVGAFCFLLNDLAAAALHTQNPDVPTTGIWWILVELCLTVVGAIGIRTWA